MNDVVVIVVVGPGGSAMKESNMMICKSHVIAFSVFLVSLALTGLADDKPPEDAAAKPIDAVSLELYSQYIARGGKINSSSIEAAIVLVADRSGDDRQFRELLRKDFATSQQEDKQRYVSRKLLSLITAILDRDGGQRWQHEYEQRTGLIGQRALSRNPKSLYQELPLLADVITYGRKSDGSDIDAFTFAIRQAHHTQGKQFLLDVLNNPSQPPDLFQARDTTVGKWPDNVGDAARFHAAVGLAELGVKDGVEWLIEHAKLKDTDGNVDRHPHVGIRTSSLRENCVAVLHDLSRLPRKADGSQADWNEWWQKNAATFTPRRIALME